MRDYWSQVPDTTMSYTGPQGLHFNTTCYRGQLKDELPESDEYVLFLPQIIAQFPYVSWTKMVPNPKKLKNIYIEMLVNVINNLQTESLF